MSYIDEAVNHPIPMLSSAKQRAPSSTKTITAAGSDNEKAVDRLGGDTDRDTSPDVVLVDFEDNDPDNPVNWSPVHKWLIVFAISWMGFVR